MLLASYNISATLKSLSRTTAIQACQEDSIVQRLSNAPEATAAPEPAAAALEAVVARSPSRVMAMKRSIKTNNHKKSTRSNGDKKPIRWQ